MNLFEVIFALFSVTPLKTLLVVACRMEATLVPLASASCVLALATLAFFADFNVLIKDFFWMDIG
jgi:hypothetical protein